jgi:drug/metabolite transporter (DMT)-like permease
VKKPLSQSARGHLAMLSFSALVAGSFSLGAMIANEIAPSALNAVRYLIATLMLGVVVHAFGPRIRREHLVAPWRYLLLGAIFALYFVLMFEGLKTAPAVSTSAVFTLTPLMTAGFGFLLLSQIITLRTSLALAIGGAGAVWVIFRADLAALLAFEIGRGEAIFFVGCVAHAVFTPLLKRWNRGEPALVSTTLVMGGCFLTLAVFGLPEIIATDWRALPPLVWITLAYLAIAASATTTFLLQYAALRLPSAKVMAYTYLTPSWVICWELALGRGVPSAMILPGIGLTILALLLLLKADAPRGLGAVPPRA